MTEPRNSEQDSTPSAHWADQAAERVISRHPEQKQFVCAAGISPSGRIHIGNFREVITVDFVVRALRDRKKDVRFIYSWDDYDALRKVPKNLPNPEMIESNLRRPLADVPDPFGGSKSYAGHFETIFENELSQVGIHPEYIYQNEAYRSLKYASGISTALNNIEPIKAILNGARTSPLPDDWTCATVYCQACGKDTTKVLSFVAPTTINYQCKDKACAQKGVDQSLNFQEQPGAKLLWRVDWPMRWAHESVDYEPGGKDHSSTGGSYDTAKQIVQTVWDSQPPTYVQYDFVIAKGLGAKFSSSSGTMITLGEALEVYEPSVVRWVFASRKPNMDFAIAFDLDVIKTYDDFDRTERIAYNVEEAEPKKAHYERRIYEMSCAEQPTDKTYRQMPPQYPFRHLCNILQICEGNIESAKKFYKNRINTELDAKRFENRAKCAWNWIGSFAPEAFRFTVRSDSPSKTELPEAVSAVVNLLRKEGTSKLSEDELAQSIFNIMKDQNLAAKEFFAALYNVLINKANGPKLAPFILMVGTDRVADLLEQSL